MNGEAGADKRGLWINDKGSCTMARLGNVSQEMAYTLAEQGSKRAARQALQKPHFGIFVRKEF